LLCIKAAILFGAARLLGVPKHTAAETSILMSQGGEFAFVVIAVALSLSLLEPEIAQFMLIVVILTMFLTPLLAYIGRKVSQTLQEHDTIDSDQETNYGEEHPVIIGGFGRVGKMLAQLLEEQRILYVAIDSDPDLVARERANGSAVFFGDASQSELLKHIGIENAVAFATTMDKHHSAEHVITTVHKNWPHVPIFARARDIAHAKQLRANGAITAIPETVEATLELCEQLLSGLGFPEDAARAIIEDKCTWHAETTEKE
jgi:CPA2 family monovalent cation:H+ antiporter-2